MALDWISSKLRGLQRIFSDGVEMTERPALDFVGATVEDDAVNRRTKVTITASGAGGLTDVTAQSPLTVSTPSTGVRRVSLSAASSSAAGSMSATDKAKMDAVKIPIPFFYVGAADPLAEPVPIITKGYDYDIVIESITMLMRGDLVANNTDYVRIDIIASNGVTDRRVARLETRVSGGTHPTGNLGINDTYDLVLDTLSPSYIAHGYALRAEFSAFGAGVEVPSFQLDIRARYDGVH